MANKDSFISEARTPNTLQKIVTLRIEQLGDDSREVLQSAAIIGLDFEYKLLRELIGPFISSSIDTCLKELERSDLIFEKSKFPKKLYRFRNEAIYQITYNLIPPFKKLRMHGNIGQYLDAIYGQEKDDNAILEITRHFLNSDKVDQAIKYSFRAGEMLFKSYRLHESLDFFIKAYNLITSGEVANNYVDLRKSILKYKCEIYLLLGKYDLSLNSLSVLKNHLPVSDIEQILTLKKMIAEVLVEKGEFRKAYDLIKEVEDSARSKNYQELLIKTLCLLAFVEIFRENIETAVKVCEDGLFLCGDKNQKERGLFFTYLGFAEYYRTRYLRALSYFNKAMSIFKQIGDKALIGKLYCNIGMVHFKRSKYDQALSHYQESLNILKDIEYLRAISITRMNLAVLFDHIGDYQNALYEYNIVLKDSEAVGNSRVLMMVLCNLGEVQARLGNYKQALRYLTDSLAFSEHIGSSYWRCSSLHHLGVSYLEIGNPKQAEGYLSQSLAEAMKMGEVSKEMEARLALAKLDPRKKENLDELYRLYRELDMQTHLGLSENLKLGILLETARHEKLHNDALKARRLYEEGLSRATKEGRLEFEFSFVLGLAQYFDEYGNGKLAREYSKKANFLYVEIVKKIPAELKKHYDRKSEMRVLGRLLEKYRIKENYLMEGNHHENQEESC